MLRWRRWQLAVIEAMPMSQSSLLFPHLRFKSIVKLFSRSVKLENVWHSKFISIRIKINENLLQFSPDDPLNKH